MSVAERAVTGPGGPHPLGTGGPSTSGPIAEPPRRFLGAFDTGAQDTSLRDSAAAAGPDSNFGAAAGDDPRRGTPRVVTSTETAFAAPDPHGFTDLLLATDRRRRARLQQWLITAAVYISCALIMALGVGEKVVTMTALIGWCVFVAVALLVTYLLIRGPWSENLSDAAASEAQVVFALVAVMWAYQICGVWRGATLFPLMLILTFGAFSSSWPRLAALTVLALAGMGASIWLLHALHPRSFDLRADVANLLMLVVTLPTCSLIAARLSALRAKLHAQRDALDRALADVRRLATQDELTGLKNRRRMQQLLELEHRRSVRSGRPFCLAVIDLDHFGKVNDRFGREMGDLLLRAFAGEALGTIRVSDLLARWDGEQFLMMMPDTRSPLARLGVDRLRERTEAMRLDAGGKEVSLTMSAGVVEHRAGESVSDSIERAGRALDAAKTQGRNRVVAG